MIILISPLFFRFLLFLELLIFKNSQNGHVFCKEACPSWRKMSDLPNFHNTPSIQSKYHARCSPELQGTCRQLLWGIRIHGIWFQIEHNNQSHSMALHLPSGKHCFEWVFRRPHTQNRTRARFVSKHWWLPRGSSSGTGHIQEQRTSRNKARNTVLPSPQQTQCRPSCFCSEHS